ncbi:MAG: hypothetical protein R2742_04260 [Micropruina glycogenica]
MPEPISWSTPASEAVMSACVGAGSTSGTGAGSGVAARPVSQSQKPMVRPTAST